MEPLVLEDIEQFIIDNEIVECSNVNGVTTVSVKENGIIHRLVIELVNGKYTLTPIKSTKRKSEMEH